MQFWHPINIFYGNEYLFSYRLVSARKIANALELRHPCTNPSLFGQIEPLLSLFTGHWNCTRQVTKMQIKQGPTISVSVSAGVNPHNEATMTDKHSREMVLMLVSERTPNGIIYSIITPLFKHDCVGLVWNSTFFQQLGHICPSSRNIVYHDDLIKWKHFLRC